FWVAPAPGASLFPYTTLFRSRGEGRLLQGSRGTGVCRVSEADRHERGGAGPRAVERRLPARERRHRQSSDAGRCLLEGHYGQARSEEHTSELQSLTNLRCRLL